MSELRTLPVLPLRDIVVFPHMVVPLFVGRDKSVRALEEVMRGAQPLAHVLWAQHMSSPAQTPEARAKQEAELMQRVQAIKHPTVQHYYKQFMNERLRELQQGSYQKNRGTNRHSSGSWNSPASGSARNKWIPASAGMTRRSAPMLAILPYLFCILLSGVAFMLWRGRAGLEAGLRTEHAARAAADATMAGMEEELARLRDACDAGAGRDLRRLVVRSGIEVYGRQRGAALGLAVPVLAAYIAFAIADRPGIAAAIFGPLAESGVNVDMIVQNIGSDGRTDMTFSCPTDDVPRARLALEHAVTAGRIDYRGLDVDENVAKVSIVGIGMRSHAGVAHKMFSALAAEGVNIKVITTSEIKVSVLVDRKYLELAVQALHDAFELEKAG